MTARLKGAIPRKTPIFKITSLYSNINAFEIKQFKWPAFSVKWPVAVGVSLDLCYNRI